jgi:hypothetical protein
MKIPKKNRNNKNGIRFVNTKMISLHSVIKPFKDMPYVDCAHCSGTGRCNCDECRKAAGLDPEGRNEVICKSCDGSGKKSI